MVRLYMFVPKIKPKKLHYKYRTLKPKIKRKKDLRSGKCHLEKRTIMDECQTAINIILVEHVFDGLPSGFDCIL